MVYKSLILTSFLQSWVSKTPKMSPRISLSLAELSWNYRETFKAPQFDKRCSKHSFLPLGVAERPFNWSEIVQSLISFANDLLLFDVSKNSLSFTLGRQLWYGALEFLEHAAEINKHLFNLQYIYTRAAVSNRISLLATIAATRTPK